MIDNNTTAAKNFYKLVREFVESVKPWETARYYDTKPDEEYDLSLVSQRVYGNRDEFLAVLASAGLSAFDQRLTQRKLILPTPAQLYLFKRQSGFESLADAREGFSPAWAET
jgi:hypothetical protein